MIEHAGVFVKNFDKAKKFYIEALKPLGYKNNMNFPGASGFMEGGHTSFWISERDSFTPGHVAFHAKTRVAVRNFHKAALKAGGKDNGAPGLRPDYSSDYYAAFILDKDGNNIEAVCFN